MYDKQEQLFGMSLYNLHSYKLSKLTFIYVIINIVNFIRIHSYNFNFQLIYLMR